MSKNCKYCHRPILLGYNGRLYHEECAKIVDRINTRIRIGKGYDGYKPKNELFYNLSDKEQLMLMNSFAKKILKRLE